MKSKKPIKRYIAKKASLHLDEQLVSHPPSFPFEKEVFYFLLDLFYRLPVYNKDLVNKDGGYITISSKYFKAFISNDFRKYIDYLICIDLYQCDGKYDTERHISLGYKLNEKFESECISVEIMPGTLIWDKITENFNRKNHKKLSEIEKQMKKQMKLLEYDHDGAVNYLQQQLDIGLINQTQYNIHRLSLDAIFEKKFYLKRNRTNWRVDSNLTNMKKELRQFILGYSQIDLVCSQPFLLNLVIKEYSDFLIKSSSLTTTISSCGVISHEKPLQGTLNRLFKEIINPPKLDPDEVEMYNSLTRTGQIYEYFMPLYKMTRKETKKWFLAALYAPNNSYNYKKEQHIFKHEFPTIGKLVYLLKDKNKGNSDFAVALQMVESEIFIDRIAVSLYSNNIPVYTVHDSVIMKDEHVDQVMRVIQEVFTTYFSELPQFKTEKLGHSNLKLMEEAKQVNVNSQQFEVGNATEGTVMNRQGQNTMEKKAIITPYERKTAALENLLAFAYETGDWETHKVLRQSLSDRRNSDRKYKTSQNQRRKIEMANELEALFK